MSQGRFGETRGGLLALGVFHLLKNGVHLKIVSFVPYLAFRVVSVATFVCGLVKKSNRHNYFVIQDKKCF
jgi:hypothetical protein